MPRQLPDNPTSGTRVRSWLFQPYAPAPPKAFIVQVGHSVGMRLGVCMRLGQISSLLGHLLLTGTATVTPQGTAKGLLRHPDRSRFWKAGHVLPGYPGREHVSLRRQWWMEGQGKSRDRTWPADRICILLLGQH